MINQAEAARAAAQSDLDNLVDPEITTDAEAWAMIGSFAEVAANPGDPQPEQMSAFYKSPRLELPYKAGRAGYDGLRRAACG